MDSPRGSRLADARADRLARAALNLALAHRQADRVPLEPVVEEAARLGLAPPEVAPALERLRARGEIMLRDGAWSPRARPDMAIRVRARELAARSFWGWH